MRHRPPITQATSAECSQMTNSPHRCSNIDIELHSITCNNTRYITRETRNTTHTNRHTPIWTTCTRPSELTSPTIISHRVFLPLLPPNVCQLIGPQPRQDAERHQVVQRLQRPRPINTSKRRVPGRLYNKLPRELPGGAVLVVE